MNGDERIVSLANELLNAIAEQGYCVRSRGDYAHVDISIYNIEKEDECLDVWNISGPRKGWRISGKLTAKLIPERDEDNAKAV